MRNYTLRSDSRSKHLEEPSLQDGKEPAATVTFESGYVRYGTKLLGFRRAPVDSSDSIFSSEQKSSDSDSSAWTEGLPAETIQQPELLIDFPRPSARHLCLEFTFIQANENNVEKALANFKAARRLQPLSSHGRHTANICANILNNVARSLGTKDQQLGAAYVDAAAGVEEGFHWTNLDGSLTPLRLMRNLATRPRGQLTRYTDCIKFTTGDWAGTTRTISDIQALRRGHNFAVLIPNFIASVQIMNGYYKEVKTGRVTQASSLAHVANFVEYWMVNAAFTLTQYNEDIINAPIKPLEDNNFSFTAEFWAQTAEEMGLTEQQLTLCKAKRAHFQQRIQEHRLVERATEDILEALLDNPLSSDIMIVETVEALRQCKLRAAAVVVESAHTLLFGILSPIQTAFVRTMAQCSGADPIARWLDWNRMFHCCLTCAKQSRWMELYKPAEARPAAKCTTSWS